jgi:hypothetical protein
MDSVSINNAAVAQLQAGATAIVAIDVRPNAASIATNNARLMQLTAATISAADVRPNQQYVAINNAQMNSLR